MSASTLTKPAERTAAQPASRLNTKQLVTMAMLSGSGYLTAEEEKGAKSVLTAAALTYVASFVSAMMQLLRLLALSRRRD